MDKRLLIIDDEENLLFTLEKILNKEPYEIHKATNIHDAREIFTADPFDVVLSDVSMEGQFDGINFLGEIKSRFPETVFIVMTGYGSVEMAVTAMKNGAFDYLNKPFNNNELKVVLKKAFNQAKLLYKEQKYKELLSRDYKFDNIIGSTKPMKDLFEMIKKIADKDVTVLITGESGTGKEMVANAIHYNSSRSSEAFIKINCAAIPSTLLESELFGYEKGAFTGADKTKKGKFELADGGTLFLDEIGDMNPDLQSKLLRVIQDGEVVKLGGHASNKVDIRLLTATNQDLIDRVKNGLFREDLFFRLDVVNLVIPPLRDRKDDIKLLAMHFYDKACKKYGKKFPGFSKKVIKEISIYKWPGNVRELENSIHRMVILSDEDKEIENAFLTKNISKDSSDDIFYEIRELSYKEAKEVILEDFEKKYFIYHLENAAGNISTASKNCDMYRANLYQKLEKYGICADDYKA
ncbi:sigma-54-dependent Fis family transcriptional regulator [bacterium]|nr:sigma-54-dependent Fis family transcriptional regulator [bacterium]